MPRVDLTRTDSFDDTVASARLAAQHSTEHRPMSGAVRCLEHTHTSDPGMHMCTYTPCACCQDHDHDHRGAVRRGCKAYSATQCVCVLSTCNLAKARSCRPGLRRSALHTVTQAAAAWPACTCMVLHALVHRHRPRWPGQTAHGPRQPLHPPPAPAFIACSSWFSTALPAWP